MMHERELIYDAKGQLHKADKAYKKGDRKKKQEMIHDRELIYDAKTDIHKEDMAKKKSMAKQKEKALPKMEPRGANPTMGVDFDSESRTKTESENLWKNYPGHVSEMSGNNPRSDDSVQKVSSESMAKMSDELRYMPVVDREKSTMSAMGAHKVLKHMKGRM